MEENPKIDPALREIFRLAYYFRQKYSRPSRSQQFWHNAAAEMAALVTQCKNHSFARDVFLACYVDIERECLERVPEQKPEQVQFQMQQRKG